MANLVSAEMKTSVMNALKDVFDTFKRASLIYLYKEESKTIVMIDPNYNSNFGKSSTNKFSQNISIKPNCESFFMRVW